jgi:hypothetical protein
LLLCFSGNYESKTVFLPFFEVTEIILPLHQLKTQTVLFFLELEKIYCRLRFGSEERGGGGEETMVKERGVVVEVEGCAGGGV